MTFFSPPAPSGGVHAPRSGAALCSRCHQWPMWTDSASRTTNGRVSSQSNVCKNAAPIRWNKAPFLSSHRYRERERKILKYSSTPPNQCFSLIDTFGCSEEALTVAAMLQVQHVFTQPSRAKAAAVSNYNEFCQLHTLPLAWVGILLCVM